jgi:hypothetical protein
MEQFLHMDKQVQGKHIQWLEILIVNQKEE